MKPDSPPPGNPANSAQQRAPRPRRARKIFFTFAAGPNYTTRYLAEDARALGMFDAVKAYGPQDLDREFWWQHLAFFSENFLVRARRSFDKRGFGFWIWKPYLIKRELDRMQDGDILVYCDAGAIVENPPHARRQLQASFAHVQNLSVGFCTNRVNPRFRYGWCKEDALVALDATSDDIRGMIPYGSGRILCRKHAPAMRIVDAWAALVAQKRYFIFDNTRSRRPNPPQFMKHIMEQAPLSIFMQKYGGSHWANAKEVFPRAKIIAHIAQFWIAQAAKGAPPPADAKQQRFYRWALARQARRASNGD